MEKGFFVLSILLVGGSAVVGALGGFSFVPSYPSPNYLCGGVQCVTEIQCDGCDYPPEFVEHVSYSRSVLSRVEELVQTVGRYGVNIGSRQSSMSMSLPAGVMQMTMNSGSALITDISTAIETMNSFTQHEVVGRIAFDVINDLSDSLSIVRKVVSWCGSVNVGGYFPLPEVIIERYQQPQVWVEECVGVWPCSTITPYSEVSAQGAQSDYTNQYSFGTQHNRGNTQIINSNYDSGSSYGIGDTASQAQNFNYQASPAPSGGGFLGGGLGAVLGASRSVGDLRKQRRGKYFK